MPLAMINHASDGEKMKKAAENSAAFADATFAGLYKLGAQEGTRTPTKLLAST
jgi:hypothetical protein